jgi:hypothetical protein
VRAVRPAQGDAGHTADELSGFATSRGDVCFSKRLSIGPDIQVAHTS